MVLFSRNSVHAYDQIEIPTMKLDSKNENFSTANFSHAGKLFTSQLAFTDDIVEVLAIVLDSLFK